MRPYPFILILFTSPVFAGLFPPYFQKQLDAIKVTYYSCEEDIRVGVSRNSNFSTPNPIAKIFKPLNWNLRQSNNWDSAGSDFGSTESSIYLRCEIPSSDEDYRRCSSSFYRQHLLLDINIKTLNFQATYTINSTFIDPSFEDMSYDNPDSFISIGSCSVIPSK